MCDTVDVVCFFKRGGEVVWLQKCSSPEKEMDGICCSARFCNSPLWLRQSLLPSEFPKALPESSFVVPGDFLHSNDMRRNYTDFQETAQWCGGVQVPKAVLGALCSISVLLGMIPTTWVEGSIGPPVLQLAEKRF